MNKRIPLVVSVLFAVAFIGCERREAVNQEREVAPASQPGAANAAAAAVDAPPPPSPPAASPPAAAQPPGKGNVFSGAAAARAPAAAAPPASAPAQDRRTHELLATLRGRGYRVTVHRLIGEIEMRATPRADPTKVTSARVKSTNRPSDDEFRCAKELAEKLGLKL